MNVSVGLPATSDGEHGEKKVEHMESKLPPPKPSVQ